MISKDSEKLYFVITFERERYKTFVEFYFDGEKDEAVTIEGEDYFESILTITPEVELDHVPFTPANITDTWYLSGTMSAFSSSP